MQIKWEYSTDVQRRIACFGFTLNKSLFKFGRYTMHNNTVLGTA